MPRGEEKKKRQWGDYVTGGNVDIFLWSFSGKHCSTEAVEQCGESLSKGKDLGIYKEVAGASLQWIIKIHMTRVFHEKTLSLKESIGATLTGVSLLSARFGSH